MHYYSCPTVNCTQCWRRAAWGEGGGGAKLPSTWWKALSVSTATERHIKAMTPGLLNPKEMKSDFNSKYWTLMWVLLVLLNKFRKFQKSIWNIWVGIWVGTTLLIVVQNNNCSQTLASFNAYKQRRTFCQEGQLTRRALFGREEKPPSYLRRLSFQTTLQIMRKVLSISIFWYWNHGFIWKNCMK